MKTLFLTIVTVLTFLNGLIAAPIKVDERIIEKFKVEFRNATNEKWLIGQNHYEVIFDLKNKKLSAIYTLDGELLGTSSSIFLEDLPTTAKRKFAKKFDGFNVIEARKYELVDENAFYIYATNESENVIVKIDECGIVTLVKKERAALK